MHGHIVGDVEQAAGQGNQQQGATGHARGTAGADRRDYTQQDGRGNVRRDLKRVSRSQRQHADGDGRAGHIDGGPQGNGDAVGVLVELELFGQGQVHGDVGTGAAGEKGRDGALAQAGQHQWIGVATGLRPDNDRVDHQRHEQHAAHEYGQQVGVVLESFQATFGEGGDHQTKNAQWSQTDHALDHTGDGLAEVLDHGACGSAGVAQGCTQGNGPDQNADVVGVQQCIDRVVESAFDHGGQHLADIAGHACHLRGLSEVDYGREQGAGHHGHAGCGQRTDDIQEDDRLDLGFLTGAVAADGGHDEQEHEHRSSCLQGGDEQ